MDRSSIHKFERVESFIKRRQVVWLKVDEQLHMKDASNKTNVVLVKKKANYMKNFKDLEFKLQEAVDAVLGLAQSME
jgi:hypothetical protein